MPDPKTGVTESNLLDCTGQVPLDRPDIYVSEVIGLLDFEEEKEDSLHRPSGMPRLSSGAIETLRQAVADVFRAYHGDFPGLMALDTPYHDLRHALDCGLVMARLLSGYNRNSSCALPVDPDLACAGIIFALFHDIGFLRRMDESHLRGASLAPIHEERSTRFSAEWMKKTKLSSYAVMADVIAITAFSCHPKQLVAAWSPEKKIIATLLGTADLLSQMAERCYLERCRDFLYAEFKTGGLDRIREADGSERVIFSSADDLLRQTPTFYRQFVKKRLEEDYEASYRWVEPLFGGENPYVEAINRNLGYLEEHLSTSLSSRDVTCLTSGLRRYARPFPDLPHFKISIEFESP